MYQVLAKLMQEHGETAADLSRATGISEALISTWKKRAENNGKLSLQNAIILSKHYGVDVEEFLKE